MSVSKVLPLSAYFTGHILMTMFRTRACALIAALLLPLPVLAAPSVNTLGGDTRVQLSGDLVGALTSS